MSTAHFHEVTPESRAASTESRVINWTTDLIEELCLSLTSTMPNQPLPLQRAYHLVKLPKTATKSGDNVGREYRVQKRCATCIKAERKEKPGSQRAPKTLWMCAVCSPAVHCYCNSEKSVCFAEHKANVGQ